VCVFYDQRTDPSAYLFDVFAAYSFDGGETFTANHRVSEVSIDPNLLDPTKTWPSSIIWTNPREKLPQTPLDEANARKIRAGLIGEYIGVDAFYDTVVASWTDTRDGDQDVFGARWEMPIMHPRLYWPENGAVLSEPDTFNWATSWKNDDDRYRVEIANDAGFSDIAASEITDTTYLDMTGLGLGTGTYFWRTKAFKISTGDSTEYSDVWQFEADFDAFICGDVNADLLINLLDILYLIDNVYSEPPGADPQPWDSGDVNSDGSLNLLDILLLIDFIYGQPPGPAPDCP
jgi:hypothetical protein